jgi:hypothetical protein
VVTTAKKDPGTSAVYLAYTTVAMYDAPRRLTGGTGRSPFPCARPGTPTRTPRSSRLPTTFSRPIVVGAISDLKGLKTAMLVVPCTSLLAGGLFLLASRFYVRDVSRVKKIRIQLEGG